MVFDTEYENGHFDSGGHNLEWPVNSKKVPPGPGGTFTKPYELWQYGYKNSWFLILNMIMAISAVVAKTWSGRCPQRRFPRGLGGYLQNHTSCGNMGIKIHGF
uniref:(northern house mosquito) hypothetical protein n=1 Tax=Culex pipiens TaxID=7175 RepID=A0A8D8AY70_CULPI